MKRVLFFLGLVGAAFNFARAEMPTPLAQALEKLVADDDHWAYTRTTRRTDKDEGGDTVERYNPSLTEDHQWQLLKFRGHEPTEHERAAWTKRRAKEQKEKEEKSLGDVIDFDSAKVFEENGSAVVYELALKKDASRRFPPEKFVAYITVNTATNVMSHFVLRARDSFRLVGVAKVNSMEIHAILKSIDANFSPQPVFVRVSGEGKVLFVKVGGSVEITLKDYQRVKPFRARFDVKIGEIKALNF